MLPPSIEDVILFVHIVAAAIWIGGQVTIAAVVPVLRGASGLASAVGRRFQAIAWPAFAVLILTGAFNTRRAGIGAASLTSTVAGRTLLLKLGLVLLSGVAAAIHAAVQAPRARTADDRSVPLASAALGGLSLVGALGAALLGITLHG